jgi:argininosuccinate lyase
LTRETRETRMGRLARGPDPLLLDLLYDPGLHADRQHVLPHLLRIDAAHVLMLAHQGILARPAARRLLGVGADLARRSQAGEDLFAVDGAHRGLYWLYEREMVRRLGPAVGGAAHVARSRNDINATVARLRMRGELLDLLDGLDALLHTAIAVARRHAATLMSCFTHLQPAQPSSLGHYLAGVTAEILRTAEWLDAVYAVVNRSPMGAAAGAGTSFAIDREAVARWLGFDEVIANAADAVASRDYCVQVLGGLAMLGTTLSRLATDLQSWGSHAYGFLSWPDELVSTSSIMPQKRNAFVWENVRGQAAEAAGALAATLVGLKSTAFSNSVEVSAEATAFSWPACHGSRRALSLATLLLGRMEVRRERMRAFLDGAETTMTALADLLVARHGLPFRTAHDAVGTLLAGLPPGSAPLPAAQLRERLQPIAAAAAGRPVELSAAEIAAALDPARCLRAARFGGGPAAPAVAAQLAALDRRRRELKRRGALRRRRLAAASRRLDAGIAGLCRGRPPGRHTAAMGAMG